jgi:hypothetical protein
MNGRNGSEMIFCKDLDEKYLDNIENIKINPIFILGLPRSGTSILYKMLSETKTVNCVTSYHVIQYDQILNNHIHGIEAEAKTQINDYFDKIKLKDRGMDKLKIYADFPEEYGYILGKQTYKMNIVPENRFLFIQLCKKIQYISENDKPLLLKNPYDFMNVSLIKNIFPNAKFIFISRHPEQILNSSMNAIRSLLKNRHPYSMITNRNYARFYNNPLTLFFSRIFFFYYPLLGMSYLLNFFKSQVNEFNHQYTQLPETNYVFTSYENICKNPSQTLKKLITFIDVKPEKNIDFDRYIKPRNIPIDPIIIRFRKLVKLKLRTYYDLFDYE